MEEAIAVLRFRINGQKYKWEHLEAVKESDLVAKDSEEYTAHVLNALDKANEALKNADSAQENILVAEIHSLIGSHYFRRIFPLARDDTKKQLEYLNKAKESFKKL